MQPRRGLDALLDVIENLQGAPLPASILETEILPARLLGYKPADLDTLIAAGEVVWVGFEPIGERDGRIGLYLAERLSALWPIAPPEAIERVSRDDKDKVVPVTAATLSKESAIVEYLKGHGASFFQDLHDGVGGGYPGETLEALWGLVWKGLLTNDGMAALRAYCVAAFDEQFAEAGAEGEPAGSVSFAADDTSDGAGPVGVEWCGVCGGPLGYGVEPCDCAAAVDAVWRGVSRDGACGESSRRLFGDL